jgi:DNA-binding transcriptional MerR regulator
MEGYLTIGEISKLTGVPISTLRYYDSEGIISPLYKDKKSNYRYYSEMQIPILRIIYYLKRLGFSNDSIKSHLKTLNYSHTLDLISQLIYDTKEEIKKLQKLHKELIKSSEQIKNLISIEEKINSFFIEESEKIKAIYVTITENDNEEKFIKAAFKKLSLYTLNTERELLPIGVCALTIPQENIENKSYKETKLLYMKDIKELTEKITLPKRKYACMYCKGSLLKKKENIDRLLTWIEENNLTKSEGDILLHFLAGPGFIKAPEEIMYIIKVPIN